MTESIPKIIHYCWFGSNQKPDIVLKCIESWKNILSDYEFREWNDEDLKLCNNKYVNDALKEKKWAFISDYFRIYALYNYGGIYLDTDCMVFKPLNDFLNLNFFCSFENFHRRILPSIGVVGAKKNNHIIKDLLDEFDNLNFYNEDGSLNLIPNTERLQVYFAEKFNLKPPYNDKKTVELEDKSYIYPSNYFSNYDKNVSYIKHFYCGSWLPPLRELITFNILGCYFRFYGIDKGYFFKEIKNIKEQILMVCPRIIKSTVVLTVGKNNLGKK